MRIKLQSLLLILLWILPLSLFSQSFTWQADTTTKNGTPGNTILFHTYLINNTTDSLELRVIRTVNQLPSGWTSSFCVGGITGICYAPWFDTIPNPVVVNASSQLELAIDFQTSVTPDQGGITVKVEEWHNPSVFLTESFTGNTNLTGITNSILPITGQYRLYTNYPNPFNPSTNVPFEIGGITTQRTIVFIYNVMGQRVKKLLDEYLTPGLHQVSWDGRDAIGQQVSSGIYFVEIRTRNQILLGKMFLLK
jgi:hypothetical protein